MEKDFVLTFPVRVGYTLVGQSTRRRQMKTHATTREHILQAAYRVLIEQGYDATTIKAIAREAEVAPGLLHYYFANKDELLVEVLRDISSRHTENMRGAMASLPAAQLLEAGLNDAFDGPRGTPEAIRWDD